MINWIPYVFVRVVIFFMGGILLGIYYPDVIEENLFDRLLIFLLVAYAVLFISGRLSRKKITSQGVVGLAAIFLSGYICILNNTDSRDKDHLLWNSDGIGHYEVVLTQRAQEREKTWKIEAEIIRIKRNTWEPSKGKILLYLSKGDFAEPYEYGDILLVEGSPQLVQSPGNPGEFDYKRFLEFRNIYHQHFLHKKNIQFLRNEPPYKFMQLAIKVRGWADETLKKYVHGDREQATASALVLGVTDGLDNELLNAYAATGAMHVLAVSGLHISIIYLIIAFVLQPLKKLRHGKLILAVASIFILWAYSFVTGLSPSVLRAVVMFSFMAVARASNRQTNIYNTLGAAAFCLLLYDPHMIMAVGFQLSFLAVLGIVYLHPLVYTWWMPQAWITNEIWKITSVSIAAQITTFPLGLLYFHQFPNYFLLSNLFVIPGSFVVLLSGIGVLAFSFMEPVAYVIGMLLEYTINVLNWIVFFVESFPFSLVENINISVLQCWLLMITIILCILLCVRRELLFLKAAVVLSVFVSVSQWYDYAQAMNTKRITVYQVSGHTAIDLTDNGHSVFYSDSALLNDQQKIRFHIHPNRLLHGVSHVEKGNAVSPNFNGYELIVWNKIIILRVIDRKMEWPQNIPLDYIIVSNNSVPDLLKVPKEFQSLPVILDSSNSFYFADKMVKGARKLNRTVHSVFHQGAFDIDLKINDHEVHNL